MENKQKIEKHIAKLFLEQTQNIKVKDQDLYLGDHLSNEPDILYKEMGIEIGAVLRGKNSQIDNYQKEFLSKVSDTIKGRIPETIQIRLVMQDDNDTVEHKPSAEFQIYKHLPKYLDGIFVCQHESCQIKDKVVLNQKTGMRTYTFPSIQNTKIFMGFVDELVNYINSLKRSDFVQSHNFIVHHRVVTEGKIGKNPSNPLEDFISPKIIEKLYKDKYSGTYKVQILLLHNYSIAGNTEFTSDIHFYTHHRDDIFNLLYQHINEHKSLTIYDSIFFLDFSMYALNTNFDLVDFKDYSPRKQSKFLHGYGEIRNELKPL